MTAPNQHGGYRQPASPAPVSGPAQLSQRTDGGPGSAKQPIRVANGGAYGDRTAAVEQQQGAPLAKADSGPNPPAPGALAEMAGGAPPSSTTDAPGGGFQRPPLTGFAAPSDRPGEPVTAGAPLGPGHGPLGAPGVDLGPGQLSTALEKYVAGDDTGYMRLLINDLAEWGV